MKEWHTFVNPAAGMDEGSLNGVREQGDFAGSALPFTPELSFTPELGFVADVDDRWPLSDTPGVFVGANLPHSRGPIPPLAILK